MISFIVTGFGPFHGVPENPTMILVQSLIQYMEHYEASIGNGSVTESSPDDRTAATDATIVPSKAPIRTAVPLSQRIRTLIIETSYKAAQQQMDGIYQELVNGTHDTTNNESGNVIVVLHLGVNGMGQQYQLECCAYNEMQFGIPDMYGDQPRDCPIITTTNTTNTNSNTNRIPPKYQSSLQTSLVSHLSTISNQLNERNLFYAHNHSSPGTNQTNISIPQLRGTSTLHSKTDDGYGTTSILSTNPGRYVCNYIYYYSMYTFQAGTVHSPPPPSPPPRFEPNKMDGTPEVHDNAISSHTVVDNGTERNHRTTDDTTTLPRVECLFLHVPPFSIASMEQQLRFVTDLMRLLELTLMESPQSSPPPT